MKDMQVQWNSVTLTTADKKHIEQLIQKARLGEAFDKLLAAKMPKDIQNQIIVLSSRFNGIEKDNIKGIVSRENYNVSRNKITNSLIEILYLDIPFVKSENETEEANPLLSEKDKESIRRLISKAKHKYQIPIVYP